MSSPDRTPDPRAVLERLTAAPGRDERLTHLEVLPRRVARYGEWPAWADPVVLDAFARRGIERPWLHQVAAAEAAYAGRHVVLSTGTASGKSLGYLLPGLTEIRARRGERGQRGGAVLYLSPTKALAQDQLAAIRSLDVDVRVATHDGDSGPEEREWARDHAEYVLTNPDMLHRSLLPGHARWSTFFGSLRYVVIDECHHYRGVFGAHVAQVVRRLRRICALYGASPTFVLASATVAEPEIAAERLTGLPTVAVTDDASPRGQVALALWEPPFVSRAGEHGAPVRRSSGAEVADLLTDLVLDGVRTLAFVRSRRGAETVALTTRRLLAEVAPELADRVAAYRGGYLPEERRALEQALRNGTLIGLSATNALELGIDISGLDAVLLAGFPGTRAALWQQVGRAGRGHGDALGVFVARDDPLDTYLVGHPEALLGAPVEASVFDPDNPYVLGPHLCAAAAESPLHAGGAGPVRRRGTRRGRRTHGCRSAPTSAPGLVLDRPAPGQRPGRHPLLRWPPGAPGGGRDRPRARHRRRVVGSCHGPHRRGLPAPGRDLAGPRARPRRARGGRGARRPRLLDDGPRDHRHHDHPRARAPALGGRPDQLRRGRVSNQVVSFLRRRVPSGEVLGEEPLDLPERTLDTRAVWWTLPADVLEGVVDAVDLPGSAHAAEHASIGLLPLFATCDRWDIGGVSTALHPDTGQLTVFVYDGHPGGAGFSERGYGTVAAWLSATREAIATCRCDDGCPSCVQSPKCGNGNEPLDKAGAIRLLDVLLSGAPPLP